MSAIESMDSLKLESYLVKNGISNSIAKKLFDEDIDGQCLLMLNDSDLSGLGLNTGSRLRLRLLISTLKEESSKLNALQRQSKDCTDTIVDSNQQTVSEVEIRMHSSEKDDNSNEKDDNNSGEFFEGHSSMSSVSSDGVPCKSRSQDSSPSKPKMVNYNVVELLKQDKEGSLLVANYLDREIPQITNEERITIVQVCVSSLTKDVGSLYPSSIEKTQMAQSIVETFPCLATKLPNVTPYCSFYNQKTNSFIETRLKTIRKSKLGEGIKRKNRNSTKNEDDQVAKREKLSSRTTSMEDIDVVNMEAYVNWMKSRVSNAVNKATILQYNEATFRYRRIRMEKELTSATAFLQEYPRYLDFEEGGLIAAEFYRLHSNAGTLDNFTSQYMDKVISLGECDNAIEISVHQCSDKFLRSLIYCMKLQPSIRKLKISRTQHDVLEELIVFRKENWNLDELQTNRNSFSKQPFLLGFGSLSSPKSFNLIIEDTIIPLGSSSLHAFHVLFSSFYCFSLHFPKFLKPFYQFFANIVYKVSGSNNIHPSCMAFEARLRSMNSTPQH